MSSYAVIKELTRSIPDLLFKDEKDNEHTSLCRIHVYPKPDMKVHDMSSYYPANIGVNAFDVIEVLAGPGIKGGLCIERKIVEFENDEAALLWFKLEYGG